MSDTPEAQTEQDAATPTPTTNAEDETVKSKVIRNDLVILPPRQRSVASSPLPGSEGLALPPLQLEEPVLSLRSALTEVVGYAHLTNYRLELETNVPNRASEDVNSESASCVRSPYTGKDAVIAVPAQFKTDSSLILDEYGDLTSLADNLQDGMGFRIVLERYDASSIKDQVNRLRSMLDGNAPITTALVEKVEERKESKEDEQGEKEGTNAKNSALPGLKPVLSASEVIVDGTNLQDFFYLAFGEDYDDLHRNLDSNVCQTANGNGSSKAKNKKKKGKNNSNGEHRNFSENSRDDDVAIGEQIRRLNQLEELVRVRCFILYSGFHPPPAYRRMLGDLAYLVVTMHDDGIVIHVTATTLGFYVNRSSGLMFDPSPATASHFSHALLDCLLSASATFLKAWTTALDASKERAEITRAVTETNHLSGLFRSAIRGDFEGFSSQATALKAVNEASDTMQLTPSWLAPFPRKFEKVAPFWKRNVFHSYNPHRTEDDLQRTFGIELRSGTVRDWNEELQLAREMPTGTLTERLERARLIHKVMTEFGEASLLGVIAISEGHLSPMNPNEATRSHVYLHNNIFFSRGVDAGPETFKIAKGDMAARKSANRDIQCIGTFHRMENCGIYTLATVLIDYLGTRFVCQSILPGILVGEKSHTLLYGTVETGVPLKWDKDLHDILEEKIGDGMMIATRPVLRTPLTSERLEEVALQRKATLYLAELEKKNGEGSSDTDPNAFHYTCVPIEAKGILGSDQRKYVLDLSRLTPRDANWVPKERGGTGRYEEAAKKENGKHADLIPLSLEDDEWTMCVLRSEIVTRFTHDRMAAHQKASQTEASTPPAAETSDIGEATSTPPAPETSDTKEATSTPPTTETSDTNEAQTEQVSGVTENDGAKLVESDKAYLQSLKFNLNVFLPHMRTMEGIDEEAAAVVKADEQLTREAADYLWDEVLPRITVAVREGSLHQLPVDGKSLTEFLHRNGVNCRYLGRLATLAREQEERDVKADAELKAGTSLSIERKTMPKCWLELVECEMAARSAKHVLDGYLTSNGGVAASQPAQTVASFLSALVSEAEETAAQTESRMEKRSQLEPDDDEIGSLTISDVDGANDGVPSLLKGRQDVWQDIETDIGRRFRYILTLYNRGNKAGRALYIPLLRRVCQRTGVRLIAKNYNVGGRCVCSGGDMLGGRLSQSYPISPLDIVEIVPLMKHAAAYNEGFAPCSLGTTIGLPPLQVSLQDARATLERAHIQAGSRALGKGLELAQEAGALYQRVTDSTLHPGVIESIDLMASIFLEAGDPVNAAINGSKALGLTLQSSGFDSAAALNSHMVLFQMLFTAREMDQAIKHLRASIYLLEIMAGPRHTDHFTAYHKLGTVYTNAEYEGRYSTSALECFREAKNRESCDRLMDGFMAKNFAKILTGLENYAEALEYERKASEKLTIFLGRDHPMTQESLGSVLTLMKLAEGKGNRKDMKDKLLAEAKIADSIAADLAAEEEQNKKKSIKKKKRGGK
jgi:protein TIF31